MTAAAAPWDWRDAAACLGEDPETFFPIGNRSRDALLDATAAKTVCAGCPVAVECLQDAGEYGVWGGLTEDERRSLKRRGERARAKARDRAGEGVVKPREYPVRGNITSPSGARRVT
jgi:WhiB family redox-sensing transcriptional regulator